MEVAQTLKGIHFVTNIKGKKTAVIIDLAKHGELWEDLYDSLTAKKRASEPRESLTSVKKRLCQSKKLNV